VPFGSYFPIIRTIVPAISDIEPGDVARVFPIDERTLGPLICFEVVFPEMSETLRRKGADFLVVITNLGWFGASNALEQELELARLRAVETRLPLVHGANTGISGVFDPWGRFTGMNAIVTSYGTFHWFKGDVKPFETKRYRCLGAMPLSEPAERPVGWAPQRVPQTAILASGILLLVALGAKWRENNGSPKQNRNETRGLGNPPPERLQRSTPASRGHKTSRSACYREFAFHPHQPETHAPVNLARQVRNFVRMLREKAP